MISTSAKFRNFKCDQLQHNNTNEILDTVLIVFFHIFELLFTLKSHLFHIKKLHRDIIARRVLIGYQWRFDGFD